MGASLAKVVLGPTWAHLSSPARILFAHMAITAKDDGRPPLYFGGREALALVLYGDALATTQKKRAAQYDYVRRVVRELKAEGAIHLRNEAAIRSGQGRAEYEVRPLPSLPLEGVLLVPPRGGTPSTPRGGTPGTGTGGTSGAEEGVLLVPPKEDRGTTGGLTAGTMTPVSAQPHLAARDPQQRQTEGVRDRAPAWSTQDTDRCRTCGHSERRCRELARTTRDHHAFEAAA